MTWVTAVAALFCLGVCLAKFTDNDSLQGALEAINRRQRDLQDPNLYYVDHFHPSREGPARYVIPRHDDGDGQPEDIGYGYQKSMAPKTDGFFEASPALENELGSHDPGVESFTPFDAKELESLVLEYIANRPNVKSSDLANERRLHYQTPNSYKKRSVFRERDVNISPDILQNLYPEESNSDRFFENGERQKVTPSPFRERFPTNPSRHSAKNVQSLVRNFGGLNRDLGNTQDDIDDSDEYLSMLNSVWEKYQDNNPDHFDPEDLSESDIEEILGYVDHKEEKKRQHNSDSERSYNFYKSPLAWVKRDRQRLYGNHKPANDDLLHVLKHLNSRTESLEPMRDEFAPDEERGTDVANLLLDEKQALNSMKRYSKRFWRGNTYDEYNVAKRYPVAKRSPNYYTSPAVLYHKHVGMDKLNQRRKKNVKSHISDDITDPKIAQELNDIFSSADNKVGVKKIANGSEVTRLKLLEPSTINSTKLNHNVTKSRDVNSDHTHVSHSHIKRSGQKEETSPNSEYKPLGMSKKSVDWSEYFGIDRRRKKSVGKTGNDEWLLDQYLKAYSISARAVKDSDRDDTTKSHIEIDNKSTDDMDDKLRAMEDMIVDQALKYTGAHEGMTNAEEVQAVKDNVIAQLAAAYSLEKMRKALSEFKSSMAAQKVSSSVHTTTNSPDGLEQKDKRVAIKKEKAEIPLDSKVEKKEDSDNKISVLHPSRHSQPAQWDQEESCPIMDDISQRCKEVANMAGDSSHALVHLCNLHQVCYLCGIEMGASASGCDLTFLAEANSLCGDSPRCRYTVQRTMATIHTFRGDPSPLGCDWQSNPCLARYLDITMR